MVERDKPKQPIRRHNPFSPSGQNDSSIELLVQRISPQSPAALVHQAPDIVKRRQAKKPIYGVENEGRQAEVVRFPNLLYADERVKYDPSNGDVYIGSWTRRDSKENPQKKTALRRWNNWGDIETAIRGSTHIVEKHQDGGATFDALKTIHNLSLSLFDKFTSGEITKQNLTEHLNSTISVLEANHLIKPTIENRQKLVQQIVSALNMDSLGRFNPLISQTKLAASAIKLLHELFIAGQTQQKYNLLLTSILHVERETERFYISEIVEKSKEMLLLDYDDLSLDRSIQLWYLTLSLLNPDLIKVAPYRKPAIMFVAYVFGFKKEYKEKWEEIFTKTFGKESLDVIRHIHNQNDRSKRSHDEFINRLRNGIQILEETLSLGERNIKKES